MPVVTEGRYAAEFLLSELGVNYSRDNIVIAAGSGVVKAGTVCGKVTASGKFKPSPAAGATGEQVGSAINIYEVDATSVDVVVSAITRGAEVNGKIIAYEATVNDDAKKSAKNAQLATAGIIVR